MRGWGWPFESGTDVERYERRLVLRGMLVGILFGIMLAKWFL